MIIKGWISLADETLIITTGLVSNGKKGVLHTSQITRTWAFCLIDLAVIA